MDLSYSDAEREFQLRARAWLAANVPDRPLAPPYTEVGIAEHRDWEKRLHDAGYAALHWPDEYGGGGADLVRQALFGEEYLRAGAPQRLNRLALGLAGPTIIHYGTEVQKARWLPGMLTCAELWCQGFSEPEAGSDLAAVRTRATRDGPDFVLNGQKTWTSLSVFADWMFALVRTDPDSSGHRGLTFVMVPMRTPGIEVRPIVQMHGAPGFAEVFLSDVRVPAANVVGEIGSGWAVAMTTLGFERGTGLGDHVRFARDVEQLVAIARWAGVANDPLIRDQIAARYVEVQQFRRYMQRVTTRLGAGERPGPEASMTKLFWSEMEARIFETALYILGPLAEMGDDAWQGVAPGLHRRYWHARAARIFAGTSEVQRNIVAERVLGLPREPRCTST
ncbi:acyl-CoA dehydrogenase family protein [Amycolatopsis acidiphila]|uniref:Acyl-CoA dehydrogenase n=1 Tax=Amycolatopsis acidiphila TaxID=715473 RepID=A0A558AHZ9_9PSEU|nr:acyl-CoA dehydrogenase family protein [Amycolatopsis acidiphila]TVT23906.1 acyl-CoA dehydrogenase [Amycolatopsis acidiphila]UIJ61117.1 acyl-CoA dehydrogenase family protein [Amycolatopsis acidiphila]GHG86645.1 putative acyl-CoA dehydrogenase FadE17 [Amycolatopsis acidiphila]